MAIAYRDGASGTLTASGGSLTVTVPATVVAGDGLIMVVDVAADLATPAGWAERKKITTLDGSNKTYVYSRVASVDDAGTTITLLSNATPSRGAVALAAYSGTDPGDPIHQIRSTSHTTSSTTLTTPTGITTSAANCWYVEAVASKSPTGNNATNWTEPAGFTMRREVLSGATSGQSQREACIADTGTAYPSGTALGGGTWTCDVASDNKASFAIALAPAAGTQTAHPISDVTVTGWTAVPSLASGSPTASHLSDGNDSSYLDSSQAPSALVGEWTLGTLVNPGAGNGLTVTVRLRDISAASATHVIDLRQGATTIATTTDSTVRSSYTDVSLSVTAGEAATIDYTQPVTVRVTVTAA